MHKGDTSIKPRTRSLYFICNAMPSSIYRHENHIENINRSIRSENIQQIRWEYKHPQLHPYTSLHQVWTRKKLHVIRKYAKKPQVQISRKSSYCHPKNNSIYIFNSLWIASKHHTQSSWEPQGSDQPSHWQKEQDHLDKLEQLPTARTLMKMRERKLCE